MYNRYRLCFGLIELVLAGKCGRNRRIWLCTVCGEFGDTFATVRGHHSNDSSFGPFRRAKADDALQNLSS
jgi:hypothetical protein